MSDAKASIPSRRGQRGKPVEKPKNVKKTVIRLLNYLKKHSIKIFISVIFIIISSLMTVFSTRLIGIAIDSYISVFNFTGLFKICILLIAIYLLASFFTWLQSILMIHVAQQTVAEIRKEIFDKFQLLPLKYFDSKTHGELMSRVTNDVDNISTMLNTSVSQVLQGILTIITTFSIMIYLSPVLTIASLVTIPILVLITRQVTNHSRHYFSERQRKLGKLNGYIEEVISGQKVVKVFTREEKEIEEFSDMNDALLDSGVKAEIFSGMIGPFSMALNNVSYALVVGAGAFMIVMGKNMTIGTISNFIIYSRQFSRPLNELANQVNTIMSAVAGAERVFDVLDQENEPKDTSDSYDLHEVEGDVELTDVNFSYEEGYPILKHINLYARPGQTIAFVGPTGAGKTTIINLLTRFYDIDSGTITIDGHDITKIKRDSLRKSLGIVLQDTYLFTGTIKDNILYGRLDATEEEVKKASKLANAHEFIRRLPQGYDTLLTDGGSNLSQGQRQMISIARAILADPAILVLDEATSSVDTRTEVKIQEAMHNLMKGRTNFVIAHRLSTIKDADLIAVINSGEIIERGNHEQLIEKKGFYYNLYMSQFEKKEAI